MIIIITILLYKNLTPQNFAASVAQANLASKNDIAALVKKQIFMRSSGPILDFYFFLRENFTSIKSIKRTQANKKGNIFYAHKNI